MKTFMLIIFTYYNNFWAGGEAMGVDSESFPGFTSRAACEAAALELKPVYQDAFKLKIGGSVKHLCISMTGSKQKR